MIESLPRWPSRVRRLPTSGGSIRRSNASIPIPSNGPISGTGCLASGRAIEDDSLPGAYLSEFDQGLYGGLLGGEVRFLAHPDVGWISSMVSPLLQDWSEFDRLHFDPAHPWWQRYRRQLEVFVERGRGKWGISHFILIDALNFVFELIGATQTYLSVEECPENVRRAIDFGLRIEPGSPAEVLRGRAAAGGRNAQQFCPVDSRPHRIGKPRSVPHDLGGLFRAMGARAGRTHAGQLRRRRDPHSRQRPAPAPGRGDAQGPEGDPAAGRPGLSRRPSMCLAI